MNDIETRSYFNVDLVQHAGDDEMICKAARVSTLGAKSLDTAESAGLINFLMKNRHGSPFEHALMTFRITAPIFVWREFMRHRIGFSYNEESGRYKILDGVFYVPQDEFYNHDVRMMIPGRPLKQVGKPGHYEFVRGSREEYLAVRANLGAAYSTAWSAYKNMLTYGIAKEVARMCLPVATYSTAYVTCNPRSLMSFLSLRTKNDDAMFKSYPQWEIEEVARNMEELFADLFPLTHQAFIAAGRVSP